MLKQFTALALLSLLGTLTPAVHGAGSAHTVRGVGRFDVEGIDARFRFRAEGTPDQTTGSLTIDAGPIGLIEGTVDCLAVSGRQAVFSGKIDSPPQLTPYFAIVVKDDRRDRGRTRDRLTYIPDPSPIACTNTGLGLEPGSRITRGNVVVD